MADHDDTTTPEQAAPAEKPAKKAPAKRAPRKKAAPPPDAPTLDLEGTDATAADAVAEAPPAKKAAAKKSAKKTTAKKTTAKKAAAPAGSAEPAPATEGIEAAEAADAVETPAPAAKKAAKRAPAKKSTAKKAAAKDVAPPPAEEPVVEASAPAETAAETAAETTAESAAPAVLFQAPEATKRPARSRRRPVTTTVMEPPAEPVAAVEDETEDDATTPAAVEADASDAAPSEAVAQADDATATTESGESGASDDSGDAEDSDESDDSDEGSSGPRRRRRRGGRRRRKSGDGGQQGGEGSDDDASTDAASEGAAEGSDGSGRSGDQDKQGGQKNDQGGQNDQNGRNDQHGSDDEESEGGTSRRRRRRRREGDDKSGSDDPSNTTTRVRKPRSAEDEITSIQGSTRLEAKKQRRRDGREAGRRRAPIVSEAEFLARRESVDRVMAIRQRDDVIQIGVLEDKVLVEHYVARESQTSLIGNVYLGRVQNVLPSMEAAFIDIGRGRNAVLYAGEVNWSALGHKDGAPRKIESVLSSGQTVLVQVTKDPIGHKGARLTSQISLAGRFLVYVPDGTTSGISRKLPDTERHRLKTLLKEIVPDTAGVIVRTAAEGASEEELTTDVARLKARWEDIEAKRKGGAPQLLYGEPDLTLKVVRDLFTEDFGSLVIQGDDAWSTVQDYVSQVAPDLEQRLERYDPADHQGHDLFTTYRVDEQIAKALDRKVWLPSGGSLVIDRTEAMTVVDVNTGKFTGSGGNLEETVTKNNLEAAEEVVRQLRLRDIGGIIVVDFIDMVLESNRDLVLRRMVECLGRDRTRHQVAEVTSLGLVQMTRKRIGTGLLEAFSENCPHCHGYGVVVSERPVEPSEGGDDEGRSGRRRGGRSGGRGNDDGGSRNGGNGGGNDRGNGGNGGGNDRDRGGRGQTPAAPTPAVKKPSPSVFAAMAQHEVDSAAQAEAADAAVAAETAEAAQAAGSAETAPSETPAAAPAQEPAVRPVVKRSDRRGGRSASKPADDAVEKPAEAPVEKPAEAPVEKPVEKPAEPTPPVEAAEPAPATGPKLVTRTRRGVSRTVATAPPPAPVEIVVPAPVAAPASAPEPPKVSTRTRGRVAKRVAGPAPSTPTDEIDADSASPNY